MQNKIKNFLVCLAMVAIVSPAARADDEFVDEVVELEDISAAAVADYQVEGSLFQQITDLEQEKVLMQLEKERAQLDLELDRLAAEKIKLHMEIDTLSGRAEQQQAEFEAERAKLAAEAARLTAEKEALENPDKDEEKAALPRASSAMSRSASEPSDDSLASRYKLVNVIGAGNQLQATVVDLNTGQNKRVSVGKTLDGFVVKSISLDDGVVFTKDGETQMLNVVGNN